jgi:hypothetical protein
LIQERYRSDPWKVLAVCILLNRVRGSFADPIVRRFFERYRNAGEFITAWSRPVETIIRPLGLRTIRYRNLKRMTKDYLAKEPFDRIRGIGKYGRDSWMIFVEGNLNVKPTDKKLRLYLLEKI